MNAATARDSRRFTEWVSEHLGLQPAALPGGELAEVLAARLRATDCADLQAYQRLLQQPRRADAELAALAAAFAVGETYFCRGLDHWRALFEQVLPDLVARAGARRVRLLSAGCASGEEPYTAALLLREWRPDLIDAVEITGLDASAPLLEKARRGWYSPWALRATPAAIKTRYFRRRGAQFELAEDIRRGVRFEHRNLLADDPLFWHPGAFDVILCRNVFIYFTPVAMQTAVDRFATALAAGGYLFLGHAETLRGVSRDYHLRDSGGAFYYQAREPGETVEEDPLFELWRSARVEVAAAPAPDVFAGDDDWFAISQRVAARVKAIAAPTAPSQRPPIAAAPQAGAGEGREALLTRAAAQLDRSDFTGAETTCQHLLALDEFDADAHYLAALCREGEDDEAGAEVRLQAAIYLDARFAMPHLRIARLLRRRGCAAAAQRHFRAALRLLAAEEAGRLALLGGGATRAVLLASCRGELEHDDAADGATRP